MSNIKLLNIVKWKTRSSCKLFKCYPIMKNKRIDKVYRDKSHII